MISFRRIAALLAVALIASFTLTGCSEGAGYAKSYAMAKSRADKCATASQAATAYLEDHDEKNYTRWRITADLECDRYALGF